jgi:hypothetical protein
LDGERLVIVAADGAGSASHSELGATLACGELVRRVEALEPNFPEVRDRMVELFGVARAALLAEADRLEVLPRELACTIVLAVVGPNSGVFAQLGDGAIVVGDGQDGLRVVFWPEPAEYVNATDFLTDERFPDLMRFEVTRQPVTPTPGFIAELVTHRLSN